MKWEEAVKQYSDKECKNIDKYSMAGRTFYSDNEFYKGYYWYYEGDGFIIDIHSFYIKKEWIVDEFVDISESAFLLSNYIIVGNGEMFNPYRRLENNSMFIVETKNLKQKCALHEKSHYISVGINFSESMIDKYVVEGMKINKEKVFKFFLETRNSITSKMSVISNDIINCKLTGVAAKLFFEEKAKEWLRISIEAYEKMNKKKKISKDDKIAIERAAKYIDDHYFMDIKQSFLEDITYMSGTKLKSVFKERYNMSITEYTQRKRMDMGENLLVTTDLDIKDVAKAVGYNSHSRFTTLFKRYKGIYPSKL